ncbi:RICIN domain-containing protein [Candidatus Sumerlaeota bacterium]|nr:RICIN domain-containing protein [Candidatus Sumerlaeota bacterium]
MKKLFSETTNTQRIILIVLSVLASATIQAEETTVYFSVSDPGTTKSIATWGADTAWPSPDNMRNCIVHMGADQIDMVRFCFFIDEPLDEYGDIGARSKRHIDRMLQVAAMAGDKPLTMVPATESGAHEWYKINEREVNAKRWVQALEATQRYAGKPIHMLEPFNEPDYGWGQGTKQNLYDILGLLQKSPYYKGTILAGPSPLNCDFAQPWYDVIQDRVSYGTTHAIAGSMENYINYILNVRANGDTPFNPEIHSIAEVIVGAEYGLEGGIWWGPTHLARGMFVRSCQGMRLGYAENRANWTAAAVYRAPDGRIRGFASAYERYATPTMFRFVCTDHDVYYNGVGPAREFLVSTVSGDDKYFDIDVNGDEMPPAIDGKRCKIVNRHSGLALEVADANAENGADIRQAAYTGGLHQQWDITRTGFGYYRLKAAHCGRTAEVADWKTESGANIRQWGMADNTLQEWFLEDAGDGYFYVRNGHSCKYMDGGDGENLDGSSITQQDGPAGHGQQWRFEPVELSNRGELIAHYRFDGGANDGTGAHDASTSGKLAYVDGKIGQALELDGADDYVTLPSVVADRNDMTVAAWVKWNGGDAWQRIFDFGNDTSQYIFLTPNSGRRSLRLAIKDKDDEQLVDAPPLPVGEWHHLAVTLCGNTGWIYLDGQPISLGYISLNPSSFKPKHNYIGKSQWPDPLFNGSIDDFRIYNYALSHAEIAELTRK